MRAGPFARLEKREPAQPLALAREPCMLERSNSHRRRRVILDVPPHLAGTLRRVESCDEMERHVDPGRYACGRDHLAAVDEAVIATRLDRRLQFAEQVELAPIRRCGSITQQAGGC